MYESDDEARLSMSEVQPEWDVPEPLECWSLEDFADLPVPRRSTH